MKMAGRADGHTEMGMAEEKACKNGRRGRSGEYGKITMAGRQVQEDRQEQQAGRAE